MSEQDKSHAKKPRGERLHLIDALRGFSIVSMVGFHFCYDLVYIAGMRLDWFRPPLEDVWRASISWTFLAIAGCMCVMSRNNLRRAGKYAALALAINVVTSIAGVDAAISFGIIFCMAASTLIAWLLEKLHASPKGPGAALALFVCFIAFLHVSAGTVGVGPWRLVLPRWPYEVGLFSWLGFPGPGFVSGDYYPVLPYSLLFLAGSAMGSWWKERGFPSVFSTFRCPPLEAICRHPLEVYVAHQPLLLAITYVVQSTFA